MSDVSGAITALEDDLLALGRRRIEGERQISDLRDQLAKAEDSLAKVCTAIEQNMRGLEVLRDYIVNS